MASSTEVNGWGLGAWGETPWSLGLLTIFVDSAPATAQVGAVSVSGDASYQVNGVDGQAVLADESVSINVRIIETGLLTATTTGNLSVVASATTLTTSTTTITDVGTVSVSADANITTLGLSGTAQLGTATTLTVQIVRVNGFEATTSIGVLAVTGDSSTFLTTVPAFTALGVAKAIPEVLAFPAGLSAYTSVTGVWTLTGLTNDSMWLPNDDSAANIWVPNAAVAAASF